LNILPYAANAQSGVINSFTTKDLQNIHAFATKYWNLNESACAAFIKKRKDNNAAGRDAWCTFVNKHWQGDWKVNDLITNALNSNGCGPYKIMMCFKTSDVCILILFIAAYSRIIIVPDLTQAQVVRAYPDVADALFGQDSFLDNSHFLKEEVWKFVEHVMAITWNRYRKAIKRDLMKIRTLREKAEDLFNGMHTTLSQDSLVAHCHS
jgi:hypothetical protein